MLCPLKRRQENCNDEEEEEFFLGDKRWRDLDFDLTRCVVAHTGPEYIGFSCIPACEFTHSDLQCKVPESN